MENQIIFSVIMAAFNSERTIEKALKSIRGQDFEQSAIEILVIDGGSTDATREIAQRYDAVILDNPVRVPEPAKTIGLKYAHGKYICIMDSDEALRNKNMFRRRYELLATNSKVKCLAIGYDTPLNSKPCRYYINAVGDPFSCFIYKTYTDSMEGLIKDKCKKNEKGEYIAHFQENDIKPIGDSGVIMDRNLLFSKYADKLETETTAALFERIITDTHYVGYIDGDNNWHYSSSSFKTFFRKMKFRVINNIYNVSESGYASKAQNNHNLNSRKYLFPLYSISLVFPLIDGVRMSIYYKHWIFLLHPIFALYVLGEIGIQYAGKILGKNKKNQSYGV